MYHMKTATVRDLRNNFRRIAAWIAAGETVEITRRGKSFATLAGAKQKTPFVMPDFEARRKAIFGDRVFTREEIAKMLADTRGDRS